MEEVGYCGDGGIVLGVTSNPDLFLDSLVTLFLSARKKLLGHKAGNGTH